jgi:hypothetical protein
MNIVLIKSFILTIFSILLLNCATYSNKTVTDQGSVTGEVFTYEIINLSNGWNKKVMGAIEAYFTERKIQPQIGAAKSKGHCSIEITYKGRVGAGIEFLTGLSLGIIPTASFAYPSHEIRISYSENQVIRKQTTYELRFWTINWLPFALPAWVFPHDNDYRRKVEIYRIIEDFMKTPNS